MTPAEIAVRMEGAAKRVRREHDTNAWLAWHIEALSRVKKLPKLRDMMIPDKPAKLVPQTAEQTEAILREWMAMRKH